MDERDLAPVAVFSGAYTDALVLQSLLEVKDITVSLSTPFLGGLGAAAPVDTSGFPRIYVRRCDAARAQELVNEFLRQ